MSHTDSSGAAPARAVPDAPALLAVLVSHQVDFVVIGGIAVAYHGYVRATKDVDVVPSPAAANLRLLWQALLELEASPEALRAFRPIELPVPFSLEALLQLGNWDLATTHGRLDIRQFISGRSRSQPTTRGFATERSPARTTSARFCSQASRI